MLFNSVDFLFFFPIVTLVYFLLPARCHQIWLLLASCLFYMDWIPKYILVLFLIIGIDFVAGQQIEKSTGVRKKAFLAASLVANIGLLCVFKYYNFFAANCVWFLSNLGISASLPVLQWVLPIGLSFHTFQALSYTIEVYKGNYKAERNLLTYALYVMFYPQLVAGPIERPQHMFHQYKVEHRFDFDAFTKGLQLMLWGFFKKMVVADRLAVLVDTVYKQPTHYTGLPLIIATVFFAFQIFCDFSGYCDIAMGAAQVMGYRLMNNFNSPYCASSIQDFWQRWHISLSTWFRDYVYLPLGGSRVGFSRQYLNIMIVFLVSGLWHGASWTFVIWGLVHGLYYWVYISWQRLSKSLPQSVVGSVKVLGLPLTFTAVCFAWVFFRASSVPDALWVITHLGGNWRIEPVFELGLNRGEFLIAIVSVFILEVMQYVQRRQSVRQLVSNLPLSFRWPIYYTAMMVVVLFARFSSQEFIYFQF